MTTPWRMRFVALAVALAVGACAGSETGNPQTTEDTSFSMELAPMPNLLPTPTVDTGYVGVVALRFEAQASCGDAASAADALGEPVVAALGGGAPAVLSLVPGDYCALHASFGPATDTNGLSLHLTGKRVDHTPFEVASAATAEVALTEPGAPFELSAAAAPVVLSLDFTLLLTGVPLETLTPESDGVVRIDADHHADHLATVEANLARALALYRDGDGDGTLSTEERSAGALASAP